RERSTSNVTGADRVSETPAGRALEMAQHAARVYERTAEVLTDSADLAEKHALRQERAGRSGAARAEHATAERALHAAQQARKAADRAREAAQRIRRSLAEDSRPAPHTNQEHHNY